MGSNFGHFGMKGSKNVVGGRVSKTLFCMWGLENASFFVCWCLKNAIFRAWGLKKAIFESGGVKNAITWL